MHNPKNYYNLIELFKIKNYYLNITENMQSIRKKIYALFKPDIKEEYKDSHRLGVS